MKSISDPFANFGSMIWLTSLLMIFGSSSIRAQDVTGHSDRIKFAEANLAEDESPAALIMQGRYAEAFSALERKVMLEPENVPAWIEYAQAVNALGRYEESQAIRNFILRELQLDEKSRQRLALIAPRLSAPISIHQWRGDISVLTGKESNANSGPSIRNITFYQSGEEPVTFGLSERSLPQKSASHLLEARLESSHALPSGAGLSTSLDLRQRRTPEAQNAASRQWQFDATLTFGTHVTQNSARQWLISASAQDYDYGSTTLFRRQRLAIGIDNRIGLSSKLPCRIQSTFEHEWRQHPTQDGIKSNFRVAQFAAVCAKGPHRWLGLVRVGADRANGPRAGGDQFRRDFSIGYRFDMGRWGQTEIQATHTESRDSEVYSSLFANVHRLTQRSQLYFTYTSAPFGGNWRAIARVEVFHQRSNIGLFQMQGHSVHAGLRYSF